MTNCPFVRYLFASMVASAERVRQRGDSLPTKFIINKTRAKQRRMSASAKQMREQGSGEPRVSRSSLVQVQGVSAPL